jgi:hypothetical protein
MYIQVNIAHLNRASLKRDCACHFELQSLHGNRKVKNMVEKRMMIIWTSKIKRKQQNQGGGADDDEEVDDDTGEPRGARDQGASLMLEKRKGRLD